MHNAAMKIEAELQPESALAFAERDLHRLVTVVIVTYRSAKVVPAALASIPSGVPVVVVDNDSRDPSAALAAAADATVVQNDRNLGFGTACNQGAAVVRTPFILFLNPDARLRPGSLAKLVSTLLADGLVAAAGPILTTAGRVQRPRRATLLDLGEMPTFAAAPSTPCDVGFISGAAMLVRTDAFRAIGGFDERIFLYLEDDDLCVRLRSAGWRLRLAPEAVVAHEKIPDRALPTDILRRHNRHTLLSMRYLAGKHALPFDFEARRRQAWRRLLLALFLLDRRRLHANLGRLQGIGGFPFGQRTLPERRAENSTPGPTVGQSVAAGASQRA